MSYTAELSMYLNYTKNIKFDEKPNYGYMLDILNKGLLNISRAETALFDWEIMVIIIIRRT